MLQQTRVKTAAAYWERWMRALPDARAFARARPAQVHKLWEGLGYYARARNAHAAARVMVRKHGGEFPKTYAEALALPGVGRYTAGAVCSIAYNQPTAVLDGNVMRVLSRMYGVAEIRGKGGEWAAVGAGGGACGHCGLRIADCGLRRGGRAEFSTEGNEDNEGDGRRPELRAVE